MEYKTPTIQIVQQSLSGHDVFVKPLNKTSKDECSLRLEILLLIVSNILFPFDTAKDTH